MNRRLVLVVVLVLVFVFEDEDEHEDESVHGPNACEKAEGALQEPTHPWPLTPVH